MPNAFQKAFHEEMTLFAFAFAKQMKILARLLLFGKGLLTYFLGWVAKDVIIN